MNIARLCQELVQINSENPPGNTEEIIHFIRGFLDSLGIRSTLIGTGDHLNLLTSGDSCSLVLCGHVDVVPALPDGWKYPPFSGEITGGSVHGRGSTDMKGGCAAILWAVRTLVEKGRTPRARLLFVCDEETSGTYGIKCVLGRHHLVPCDVVIGEPTHPHHPNIGQKGLARVNIAFRGEPGHGSLYPVRGVSAVMEAYTLLSRIGEMSRVVYAPPEGMEDLFDGSARVLEEVFGISGAGDILRRIMYNPGKIEGGEKANIVAQHCDLELDMRVPWGCPIDRILGELMEAAPRGEITRITRSEPSLTVPGSRIVETVCRRISEVHGVNATPIVQWAASDARYLRSEGFRVVEYGPGDITKLHAVDEYVAIESLEKAALVYEKVIQDYETP